MSKKQPTITELRRMSTPNLREFAKKKQIKIPGMWKLRKSQLIDYLDPRDPITAFLEDGGEVKQCRPQRNPKLKPEHQYSAPNSANRNPGQKEKKKKKSGKKGSKKTSPGKVGKVGIPDLSKEVGISPAKVRRVLRELDIQKPAKQWNWKSNDPALKEVRKLLKKAVK